MHFLSRFCFLTQLKFNLFTILIPMALFSSNLLGTCQGRWAYQKYKTCRHTSFGAETYNKVSSEICGVQSYKSKAAVECGVELYNEKRDPLCGVELYNERKEAPCPASSISRVCVKKETGLACLNGCKCLKKVMRYKYDIPCRHEKFGVEKYNACRHANFGVEKYKTCRHVNFGVEAYKECEDLRFGVATGKKGTGPVCGVEDEILYTNRGQKIPSNSEPHLLNDNTSGCTTCDDLKTDNDDQIKKKFKCLKAAVKNAEMGANGFSYPDLLASISGIKKIHISHSHLLSNEDEEYIFSLIDKYPTCF
jgi:hypothetical protein